MIASVLRRGARLVLGLTLGAVSAVAELLLLVLVAPVLLAVSRRALRTGAQALAELERRRLVLLGPPIEGEYAANRAVAYLALRWPLGLLGGAVLFLLALGAGSGFELVWEWLHGREPDHIPATPAVVSYILVASFILLFLAISGLIGVAALESELARRMLGPNEHELLRRRITELSVSRAEVVRAVDDERRRIERDLHDGVQQRLVALGMLIGRARRNGSPELLRQAHEETSRALNDLREVSWRIYPAALDDGGLGVALEAVAERTGLPVTLDYELAARPPHPVETVAYFVVCEAVTNAAKHSGADRVRVRVSGGEDGIVITVSDGGCGGADPEGSGLSGLARRVAALDGTFRVDSPPGGPTTIVAELPCG